MKNKLKIILIVLFLAFISYESYIFINAKGNTFIYISGQSTNSTEDDKAILYVNDNVIDTIYLNRHFAYYDELMLPFGKSTLKIKKIDSDTTFTKRINFYGIYKWNIIEYTDTGFIDETYFFTPGIE